MWKPNKKLNKNEMQTTDCSFIRNLFMKCVYIIIICVSIWTIVQLRKREGFCCTIVTCAVVGLHYFEKLARNSKKQCNRSRRLPHLTAILGSAFLAADVFPLAKMYFGTKMYSFFMLCFIAVIMSINGAAAAVIGMVITYLAEERTCLISDRKRVFFLTIIFMFAAVNAINYTSGSRWQNKWTQPLSKMKIKFKAYFTKVVKCKNYFTESYGNCDTTTPT